jgi:hypothetical protein
MKGNRSMVDASAASDFDEAFAHRRFSGMAFNRTWELLDKSDRTERENDEMLAATFASLWHWLNRPDATDLNLSIGYWQIARVFTVLGDGPNGVAWGEKCLAVSQNQPPFYLAYAHEAMARGYRMLGDESKKQEHRAQARKLAEKVEEAGERSAIEADLATVS